MIASPYQTATSAQTSNVPYINGVPCLCTSVESMGCFYSRRVGDDDVVNNDVQVEFVSVSRYLATGEPANFIPAGKELYGWPAKVTGEKVPCEMTHEELVVEHVRLSQLVVAKKNEINSIQSKLDLSEMDVGALKGELNRRNEELREANKWKLFWMKSSESHGSDVIALKKQVERLERGNKFMERCIKDLKHQLDDNSRSDQAFRRILHSQIDAEKEKVKSAEALIKSMQEEPNSQLDLLTSQIAELRLENEFLRATRAERGFLKSLTPRNGQVAHASD